MMTEQQQLLLQLLCDSFSALVEHRTDDKELVYFRKAFNEVTKTAYNPETILDRVAYLSTFGHEEMYASFVLELNK